MMRLFIPTLLCLVMGCQSIKPVFGPDDATRQDAEKYDLPRVIDDKESNELSRLPEVAGQVVRDNQVRLATYADADGPMPPEPELPEHLPEPLEAAANADMDELTLDQLLGIAMRSNPVAARSAARISALRGKWVQVGLPPNPTVGYAAEDIGLDDTAGRQGGFVGQTFVTGGKLQLNRAVVSQEIVQAEQNLAEIQRRVETDVRIGYYRVLIAQRQIELARELLKISQQAVETSETLLRAQEVSEVALLQNSMQAQDAQILVYRAESEHTAAWKRLAAIVGRPDLKRQHLVGDLHPGLDTLVWDDVLQRLLRQSPELAGAAAQLSRARMAFEQALVKVKPNINVQATVQHETITDDVLAAVQVGVPLPIWDRNQGEIRTARAEIIGAERNIERIELQLRDRLADEFNRYGSARYEVEMYSSEILPKARRTLDLVTRGYQQGEIGYLNQLAAQRTFFQTNLAYMRAQRELWKARLRIDGLLLDGSLNADDA